MRFSVSTIGLLLVLSIGQARADWEYTRWGMTPQEVVAASHGAASQLPAAKQVVNAATKMTVKASGTVKDGALELNVRFAFDTASDRLAMVLFEAENPSQNDALRA